MDFPRRIKPPAQARDEFEQVLQMRDSWWRLGSTYYMSFPSMVVSVVSQSGWLDWYWALTNRFGRWEVALPDFVTEVGGGGVARERVEPVRFFTYHQALKLSESYPGASCPLRAKR